ncbi:hypothetical protein [Oerskovia enterophila]|uniref:hypothetical protein n=1 Tax=Oerskovia enterophila TaxID=43678 RepID=UPI00083810F0|nr:hypothetical protein [Oerskovia enterophila]
MRWDLLFADLAAQLDAAEAADAVQTIAELTRAEQATILLTDRLRAAVGALLDLHLVDGHGLTAEVRDVAPEWVLLAERSRQHVVPLTAIASISGLTRHAVAPTSRAEAGRSLGAALRALMRDRAPVRVRTRSGHSDGRIARVGRDHLDIEELSHEQGPGRAAREGRLVPFSALVCVSET